MAVTATREHENPGQAGASTGGHPSLSRIFKRGTIFSWAAAPEIHFGTEKMAACPQFSQILKPAPETEALHLPHVGPAMV